MGVSEITILVVIHKQLEKLYHFFCIFSGFDVRVVKFALFKGDRKNLGDFHFYFHQHIILFPGYILHSESLL